MKEITYESAIRAMYVSNLDSMSQDWIIEKLKKLQSIEVAEQPAQEDECPSCAGVGIIFKVDGRQVDCLSCLGTGILR